MLRYLPLAILVGSALAARVPSDQSTSSMTQSRCEPDTSWTAITRDYITDIVTASGPTADSARTAFALPHVAASEVTVITADSICAAAYSAQMLTAHSGDTTKVQHIGVIRVGSTRYVIEDASRNAGEWDLLDIFDDTFHYLGSITM